MATDALATGRFLWYELMTTDIEGARAFYPRVAGWEVESFPASPTPYWVFTAGGQGVAGMMALPETARAQGAPPNWLAYAYVTDLDARCRKAEALGGKIVVPVQAIDTVGRFTVVADPDGATIGILEPSERPAPAPERTPAGHFRWAELATADPEAAFDYYTELLGWHETDRMDMGESGVYRMFGAPDNVTLGGIYKRPAEVPASAWLYYVSVGDLDESVGTVDSLGGKLLNGPMDVPGGERVAQCMDPQGAAIALHAYG
jgi:uncharacterized protein